MIINNIKEFAEYNESTIESLERDIYKYTDCGAWIKWTGLTMEIGSIVENSDAEFSRKFTFPFDSDEYENWMEELEELTDEAWYLANGDDEDDE